MCLWKIFAKQSSQVPWAPPENFFHFFSFGIYSWKIPGFKMLAGKIFHVFCWFRDLLMKNLRILDAYWEFFSSKLAILRFTHEKPWLAGGWGSHRHWLNKFGFVGSRDSTLGAALSEVVHQLFLYTKPESMMTSHVAWYREHWKAKKSPSRRIKPTQRT